MAFFQGEEENLHTVIDDDYEIAHQAIAVYNCEKICEEHTNQEIQAVVHRVEGELQLKLGMIVHGENEAYDLYNDYGYDRGFGIRRDQNRYMFGPLGTKELHERTYVCCKEGFRDSNPFEVKRLTVWRLGLDVPDCCWRCSKSRKSSESLYEIREKWCPVFSSDFFSANMKSTQRSESTNSVFQKMSGKLLMLTEFVEHYEDNAEKMREAERNEDFWCANGRPRVIIPSDILIHAVGLYTTKMFTKFQEEFNRGVAQKVTEHIRDGVIDCYKVRMNSSSMVHTVRFDTYTCTINCSCKKFEKLGLLCSHILRILNVSNDVSSIPEKYIYKRWTKGAKDIGVGGQCISSRKKDVKESKTVLFSRLMHKSSKIINLACFDERTTKIFEEMINGAYEKIKKYKDSLGHTNGDCLNASESQIHASAGEKSILYPPRAKTKGSKNKRFKSALEKRSQKKKMCPQKHKSNPNNSGFSFGLIDLNAELDSFGVSVRTCAENQGC